MIPRQVLTEPGPWYKTINADRNQTKHPLSLLVRPFSQPPSHSLANSLRLVNPTGPG